MVLVSEESIIALVVGITLKQVLLSSSFVFISHHCFGTNLIKVLQAQHMYDTGVFSTDHTGKKTLEAQWLKDLYCAECC